MERNVDMAQISDGKKYTSNDLAKLGCEIVQDAANAVTVWVSDNT